MKRPDIPSKYVYKKEKFHSIHKYQWKNKQQKHIIKITADHIAFIAEQIENAKKEKEVF